MSDITDQFRSTVTGWLLGTIAGWGTILLTLSGLVALLLASGGTIAITPYAPLAALVVGLGIIGWRVVESLSTSYEMTADRLILRRGILFKSIDEIELYRVKDVRLDYTLINQMAGIGTLTLATSDGTTTDAAASGGATRGALVMSYIGDAIARREALRTRVEAARQRRLVREIDLRHEDL